MTHTHFEALESRRLLSSAVGSVIHPLRSLSPDAGSSGIAGYTPQQIRSAYQFDSISFSNGTVAGTGAGQTIAIVDAFNDPNIASDLHTFDLAFGLSDPGSFLKVGQTGGSTTSVANDAGWSGEISLDVEWAHAMAPQADILLVEANSDSLSDLMSAVDYARNAPNVSTVSMSWGGSEFRSETAYDHFFTTPAGHEPVSFVAASGDSGPLWGPEWPASSPNVLSVGGTSLLLSSSAGGYGSESAWADSSGGVSGVETEPSYQMTAQSSGRRSSPDVSFDANPATGFAVYDSVSDQGSVGWSVFGGTSAGAPQWAAIIAIADQGRALNGLTSLDGAGATLPTLYKLYSSPTTYSADFDDVTSNARRFSPFSATPGYDTLTGLGSPKADGVVRALDGVTSTATIVVVTTKLQPNTRRAPAVATSSQPAELGAVVPLIQIPSGIFASRPLAAGGFNAGEAIITGAVQAIAAKGGAIVGRIFAQIGEVSEPAQALAYAVAPLAGKVSAIRAAAAAAGEEIKAPLGSLAASSPGALESETVVFTPMTARGVVRRVFHIAHLGLPANWLDDSLANLANDLASIPSSPMHLTARTAWTVTAAALVIDTAVVVYYLRKDRRQVIQRRATLWTAARN